MKKSANAMAMAFATALIASSGWALQRALLFKIWLGPNPVQQDVKQALARASMGAIN